MKKSGYVKARMIAWLCVVVACTPPPQPSSEELQADGMALLSMLQAASSLVTGAPSGLSYAGSPFTFTIGAPIVPQTPAVTGTVSACTVSPTLPAGLSISGTCTISGTPSVMTPAANYTVTGSNALGATTAIINITVNNAPPSALSYSGSPYTFTQSLAITTQTPTVTGTVTSCSASPTLPTGLSISSTTCAISGTPTALQGATAHTITAANAFGNTTASISITVNLAPPSGLTYSGSPYVFVQNTAITTQTPTVTGTVTGCSASPTLPTGLSLSATTCAISGTPTVTQAATSHTITASNAFGNTTASIDITVNVPAPSALTYSGSPYTFLQNAAITTQTPSVTGTVTSCSASPTLPAGLSISATTCAISGTPTATQAATSHTITASNVSGSTTASINVTVNAPPSGRRIFVPSGPGWPRDANLGGPTGADALCNNTSLTTNKPPGTYKAMVVDSSTRRPCATPTDANCSGGMDPSWIMVPNTLYYAADGTTPLFTTNANGIFIFGTLTNAVTSNFGVWTGLNADWTNHGNDCSAWTSNSGGAPSPSTRGKQGQSDQTNGGMLAVNPVAGVNCGTTAYVYCVEQ